MDVTIPDLPPGAAPVAGSPFESVEGGTSVRYSLSQITAAIGGTGAFLPITGGTLTGALTIGPATGVADAILDIAQNRDAKAVVSINNPNAGAFAYAGFAASNGVGHGTGLYHYGAGFGPLPPQHADGAYLFTTGNGGITFNTLTASPLYFATNSVERARITADGFFKASDTGTYYNVTNPSHELVSDANSAWATVVVNKGASNPYGLQVKYTAASLNGTSNHFFYGEDGGGTIRFTVMSNGGIQNYSANNVNLSDATLKAAITPYADADLDALETSFRAVDWGTFRYKDQSHTDRNHGYTAQGVERAFAHVAPELVDDTELGPKGKKHKAVYDSDLTHIGMALLARALARIADLEARLTAAGV